MKISAIICAHNPRTDYLQRVLAALRDQTLSNSEWELLLIDNCSANPLAQNVDLGWHPNGRVVREETLGLAMARVRGIAESRGDLLLFVDDDNVLAPDYLHQCLRIGADWPRLGVWGGSVVPEFEVQPPEDLRPYMKVLPVREVTKPLWSNVWDCRATEPWGAGLCVRRRAAMAYRQFFERSQLRLTGRTGDSLLGGEDLEIVYITCGLGLGMGLFPDLKLIHLIPERRLDRRYLLRLTKDIQTTLMVLSFKWGGRRPKSPFSVRVLMQLLNHCLFKRGSARRLGLANFRATLAATRMIGRSRESNLMARQGRALHEPPPLRLD